MKIVESRKSGKTLKEIAEIMHALDNTAYPKKSMATVEQVLEMLNANSDGVLFYYYRDEIIGYVHVIPVKKKAVDLLLNRTIRNTNLLRAVVISRWTQNAHVLLRSIVLKPEFQDKEHIEHLTVALENYINSKSVVEIVGLASTEAGAWYADGIKGMTAPEEAPKMRVLETTPGKCSLVRDI